MRTHVAYECLDETKTAEEVIHFLVRLAVNLVKTKKELKDVSVP
jgi:hypothetical protein